MLGKHNAFVTFVYLFIIAGPLLFRQALKDEYLCLFLRGCLGTLCLGFLFKSRLRSLRNLRCFLISE
jgi:hypothetical protein